MIAGHQQSAEPATVRTTKSVSLRTKICSKARYQIHTMPSPLYLEKNSPWPPFTQGL
jgi:hypothetical protein